MKTTYDRIANLEKAWGVPPAVDTVLAGREPGAQGANGIRALVGTLRAAAVMHSPRRKRALSQAEVDAAVKAWRDRGGSVTQCPPMAAAEFGTGLGFGA